MLRSSAEIKTILKIPLPHTAIAKKLQINSCFANAEKFIFLLIKQKSISAEILFCSVIIR